jgi:uncharacterized protein (TIGR00369 family)
MSPVQQPLPRRSAEDQRVLDDALIDIFEQRIVFNTVLGLKILSVKPLDVRGRIDMRHDLVGHFSYGRLHGGVISSTLDAMGGLALMVAIGEQHADEPARQVLQRFSRMGTIDLRIDYLRQGIGQYFIATTEVTRLGGRIGSAQMRLTNDEGVLIATGAGSYAVS